MARGWVGRAGPPLLESHCCNVNSRNEGSDRRSAASPSASRSGPGGSRALQKLIYESACFAPSDTHHLRRHRAQGGKIVELPLRRLVVTSSFLLEISELVGKASLRPFIAIPKVIGEPQDGVCIRECPMPFGSLRLSTPARTENRSRHRVPRGSPARLRGKPALDPKTSRA